MREREGARERERKKLESTTLDWPWCSRLYVAERESARAREKTEREREKERETHKKRLEMVSLGWPWWSRLYLAERKRESERARREERKGERERGRDLKCPYWIGLGGVVYM